MPLRAREEAQRAGVIPREMTRRNGERWGNLVFVYQTNSCKCGEGCRYLHTRISKGEYHTLKKKREDALPQRNAKGKSSGNGARSRSTSPTAGAPADRICRSWRMMGNCSRLDAGNTCGCEDPPAMSAAVVGAIVPNACAALANPTSHVQSPRAGSIPRLHTVVGAQSAFTEKRDVQRAQL